jgi:hypothetical protein
MQAAIHLDSVFHSGQARSTISSSSSGGVSRYDSSNPGAREKLRFLSHRKRLTMDQRRSCCRRVGYAAATVLLARSSSATVPAICFSRVRIGNRRTRLCRISSSASLMSSRSCIPTLDLSAPLSFDPGEFIMFKVMGNCGLKARRRWWRGLRIFGTRHSLPISELCGAL